MQKFVKFCSGNSLATNSLATQSHLLQNTANNTKFSCILYIQAGFMSSYYYIFSSSTIWPKKFTSNSIKYNKQGSSNMRKKTAKQQEKNAADCLYGKPIWSSGPSKRSRSLRRNFPREASAVRADAKLESSTKNCFWDVAGGLEISKIQHNFNGLREIFFFCLQGDERILLGPGGPKAGEATGTYSTRPSSTTSEKFTPVLDAVSLREMRPTYRR